LRDGRGGLLSKGRGDHEQAIGATIVTQLGMAKFGDGSIGDRSGRRTKRGCVCDKHPAIEYITR